MTTETVVEETVEETAAARGARSQTEKHEAFVEWYLAEFAVDLNEASAPEIIAAFAARRNDFRRSDLYVARWGKDAREAAKAEREAAREAARAEREATKAARAAEASEAAEGDGEAKPKRTRKKVAKKDVSEDEVFD